MTSLSRPVVVVRIAGGLGNQLFGYAVARRLALKNDADLAFDTISGFAYDFLYRRSFQLDRFSINYRESTRRERFEPFPKVGRYLVKMANKLRKGNGSYFSDYTNAYDPSILESRFSGTAYLEGYWQNVKYFKDCESVIRKELRFKPPIDSINLSLAKKIKYHQSIAIHARFFYDSITGSDVASSYYNAAIAEMEEKFSNPHYYLFSDQPDEAVKKINLPIDRVTIVRHNQGDENAYADLWLMSLCNHFIIANSTFSWWGAWLSEAEFKHVIAPDYKVHGGGDPGKVFSRLILKEWRTL
jgi:hypothetical protein